MHCGRTNRNEHLSLATFCHGYLRTVPAKYNHDSLFLNIFSRTLKTAVYLNKYNSAGDRTANCILTGGRPTKYCAPQTIGLATSVSNILIKPLWASKSYCNQQQLSSKHFLVPEKEKNRYFEAEMDNLSNDFSLPKNIIELLGSNCWNSYYKSHSMG